MNNFANVLCGKKYLIHKVEKTQLTNDLSLCALQMNSINTVYIFFPTFRFFVAP